MEESLDFVVDTNLPEDLPNCRASGPQNLGTGEEAGQEQKGDGTETRSSPDRLSALPDILCQHIVSFLPAKDARRIAFLSRRWRLMWYSSPSFTFDEREFHGRPLPLLQWYRSRQNFIRFVDEALEFRNRHFDDLGIEKFKVSMRLAEEVSQCIDKWIAFALQRNVKELSVIAEMKDLIAVAEFFHPFRTPYVLPQAVFTARSVQYLELVFCDLSNVPDGSIELPLLRNLEMISVHMIDSTFKSILSGSPLLEKINLSVVCGLEKIQVLGEKLKMLVVFKCFPLDEVVVKAPNVQSLLFRGKRQNPDNINLSSCQKLKFLWLQRAANVTDDMQEKVTHQNPNLEILILSHCSALKNAAIRSPNLWMLVMFKCKHLASAKIEAPSLRAFEYSGQMITFHSVVSSAQLDAIFHMIVSEICSHWYARLKDMCARFDHCRTLWKHCNQDTNLIIPHEIRECLLPQLHGLAELKIHVKDGTTDISQQEGIRWIFPGMKNLYVETDGSTHHFQYGEATGDVRFGTHWRKCRDVIRQERDKL